MKFTPVALFALLPAAATAERGVRHRLSMMGKGNKDSSDEDPRCVENKVVVANRGGGSISVITEDSGTVTTIDLPRGRAGSAEPMYVNANGGYVYVGDRANDVIVVFDAATFDILGRIPTGRGVFHQWINTEQLWVVCDMDKSITVIDVKNNVALKNVALPEDAAKPHDIFVTPAGDAVFVTTLDEGSGEILKYDTKTFDLVDRATVGQDPHLFATFLNCYVWSPQQGASLVSVLNQDDLSTINSIPVPAAHGISIEPSGNTVYVTNISGGGLDGLFAIDARDMQVLGSVSTPFPVPHNIATTNKGTLFVTHSGATATQVTQYEIDLDNNLPEFYRTFETGLNPFGIGYVEGTCGYL